MGEPLARLQISGNVTGQAVQAGVVVGDVVVGDHNIAVYADRSLVTVIAPEQRPQPRRRANVRLLPRVLTVPIGRDQELDQLTRSVVSAPLVELYGEPGTGKTTLIRYLATKVAEDDDIVFLPGAGRGADDLSQDLFEACYETFGYRPNPVEMRQFMAGVRVRVLIDDLDLTDEQRAALLDLLPDAPIMFASTRRQLWPHGESLALTGLSQDGAAALLAHALGRPLTEPEHTIASALWQATDGSPMALLRAASAARLGPDGVAALPQATELGELLPRIIAGLSAAAREAASVLGLAGPAGVATGLLPWLVADPNTLADALIELTALGVVAPLDDGYRLAPTLDPTTLPPLAAGLAHLDWICAQLPQATSPYTVAAHATLITTVIDATIAAGRPDLGAGLAKTMAPLAACSLRLDAWERILAHGKAAAEQAADLAAVAYLTHEDGVRNLVTGRRAAAVALVGASVTLWYQLGDLAHVALAQQTQAVLGTATAAPASASVGGQVATHTAGHTAGHTATHAVVTPHAAAGIGVKTGIGIGGKLAITAAVTAVAVGGVVGGVKLLAPNTPSSTSAGQSYRYSSAPTFDTPTETTTTATPTGDATAQAAAVTALLNQAHTDRQSVVNAVNDALKCGDLGNDNRALIVAQVNRAESARQAAKLATDALPGGSALPNELAAAFTDSATADGDYAQWAMEKLLRSCQTSSVTDDPNYAAGQTASQQANQDKQALLATWNPIAQQYGQPTWTEPDI